jgi:hypothetical protein
MKLKEFVDRLENMLTNRARPCNHCPAQSWYAWSHTCFDPWTGITTMANLLDTTGVCRMCQEFMGLPYKTHGELSRHAHSCPCNRLHDKTIAKAFQKIKEFRDE